MNENLFYRRQFILNKTQKIILDDWKRYKIGEYYLNVHPDLDIEIVQNHQKTLIILGSIYDAEEHYKNNMEILKDIFKKTVNLKTLFIEIKKYSGRYALIYKDYKSFIIRHDAFGLKEIYYCTKNNDVICGSQPNLLSKFSDPEITSNTDPNLIKFFKEQIENSSWIGDETYYSGIKHLLPNHYLNIENRKIVRYWPNEKIKSLEFESAVTKSCNFLKGTLKSMVQRHPVMIAVTAGFDSRTILAATKEIKEKIYYFINDEDMGKDHPDIRVPKEIFNSIGVPFHIHEIPKNVDEEFRKIFLNNVFLATERILPTIYNIYYKMHSEKVNIIGTGEIGRTRFGKEPKRVNSYRIGYKLGYKSGRFVIEQSEKILKNLYPIARQFNINLLSLLHMEQNKGNRWVVGNSESDIAIEEVDPFDSHMLIETFWGVDEKYTIGKNVLFIEIIKSMWPEILQWPINPPFTKRDKMKWVLSKIGLFNVLKEMQYQVSYYLYLCKKYFYII